MIKSKKQMFVVISVFTLVLLLGSVTYAFFNYTRTGTQNTIKVGRIAFNSTQNGRINLANVFPISASELENDVGNHGEVIVNITGDTTYSAGMEYLLSFSEVNNIVNGKKVPIKYNATPTNLGDVTPSYWTERGGNASYYNVLDTDEISEDKYIMAGYIKSGSTGINGSVKIEAYIDKDEVAITDTPDENSDWQNGRVVLTTEEWNSLATTPLSFKIKVEANEGVWVRESLTPESCFTTRIISEQDHTAEITGYTGGVTYTLKSNLTQEQISQCATYMGNEWGNEEDDLDEGETWEAFCAGTGTYWGDTFQEYLDGDWFGDEMYPYFESIGIVTKNTDLICSLDVIIPRTINGYTIVKIADGTAFNNGVFNKNSITKVVFPDSMTSIGDYAFYSNKIVSVEIPNTLTSIGKYAFGSNRLTNVVIPDNITLKEGVFSSNRLTNITIPNGVTTISGGLFSNNLLTNIIIPDSVTSIGDNAFGYNKLISIEIPNSVTSIGKRAFESNNLTSVVIPSSLTIINEGVFSNNKLTSVTIPNSVVEIKGGAYFSSSTISDGWIGAGAFANNQLTSVTIPNSVKKIGDFAFYHNKIANVEIPSTVTTIGKGAFNNNSLSDSQSFIYNRTDANQDGIAEIDTSVIISYGGINSDVTIPSGVIKIEEGAFLQNILTNVVIPDSVTSIGQGAFSYNQITNVSIGSGILSIGKNAFNKSKQSSIENLWSNPNLSSITINKSCSAIKSMSNYSSWLGNYDKAGTTIYGANNEVCDAF